MAANDSEAGGCEMRTNVVAQICANLSWGAGTKSSRHFGFDEMHVAIDMSATKGLFLSLSLSLSPFRLVSGVRFGSFSSRSYFAINMI